MDSQHQTDGTGALASEPSPPTEAQQRRRSFTLVPFDQRHNISALQDKATADPELADFLETVDTAMEIDWQLRRWLSVQDNRAKARERLAAAKAVFDYYEQQDGQLMEFFEGEQRERYEELVAREHKGKSKYTDHPLAMCEREDLIVRVGMRSLQPLINIFDESLLVKSAISAAEDSAQGIPSWLTWHEPTEGYFSVNKAELNKVVKSGEKLPGVEIIEKPDQLYFQDKSGKDK